MSGPGFLGPEWSPRRGEEGSDIRMVGSQGATRRKLKKPVVRRTTGKEHGKSPKTKGVEKVLQFLSI